MIDMNKPAAPGGSGPAHPRLPVFDTVTAAYRSVFAYPAAWLRIAVVPVALSIVLMVLMVLLIGDSVSRLATARGGPDLDGGTIILLIVFYLGLIACSIAFISAWMRHLITRRPDEPAPIGFRFKSEEWGFVGYGLLLTLLGMVVGLVVGFVGGLLVTALGLDRSMAGMVLFTVLLYGIIIYLVLRLSLVFPAVSVGETGCLSQAWSLSRGNVLRLLAAMLLITIPYYVGVMILFYLLPMEGMLQGLAYGDVTGGIVVLLVFVIVYMVGYVLAYAGLAHAYRNLRYAG
jgi:hypothetical protein